MKKWFLLCSVLVAFVAIPALAGSPSGIYVEFYNPTADFDVAPDGWQTVPGFPCRHGPDADNDGIPDNGLGDPEPGLSSGSPVNIYDATSVSYRVFAWTSSLNIGNVYISTSSSGSSPTLYIGAPSTGFWSGALQIPTAGCTNLGGVSYGNGKPKVQGYILGTLTGSISAYELRRFDFGTSTSSGAGTISGNITHNPGAETSVPACNGIYAKHVDSGSVILANRSNISTIRVYDDFEGAIQTQNDADITTIDVQGDFVDGTLALDSDLTTLTVGGDATGSITVDGDVFSMTFDGHWGALPSGSTTNYDSSTITIGGDVTGTISADGDFVGDLTAGTLADLEVAGGIYDWVSGAVADADISVSDSVSSLSAGEPTLGSVTGNHFDLTANQVTTLVDIDGSYASGTTHLNDGLPYGALISISGSLDNDASIEVEYKSTDVDDVGLSGQVVINSEDQSGLWNGDVKVIKDSTTLTMDGSTPYDYVSSELGVDPLSGESLGAVGLAPFNFHQRTSAPPAGEDRDCDPYTGEAVFVGPSYRYLPEVRIRHYGPVYVDTAAEQYAYTVEFKSDVLPSSWVDRTELFMIDDSRTATDTNAIAPHRDIYLVPDGSKGNTGFEAAGRWRIRPNDSELMDPTNGPVKCADVDGNPDVDYSGWYTFRVFLEATGGGLLLENGTTSFEMTEWGIAPYEVNADGETDSQDFTDLANSYSSQ